MLRPSKHAHPDQTVLAAASILLHEMRRRRAVTFDDLQAVLRGQSRSAEFLFTPAVSLLHLLGLIEYRPKADVFEYVGA